MKLNLNGNINRIYVQSLCLMFYHGVKFPVNEESEDNLELTLDAYESDEGVFCRALLREGDREESAQDFCPFSSDESKDRTYKIAIGRAVFEAGKNLTGKKIGWGILTGIRPSKVAADIIGKSSFEDAKRTLREKYLLSEEKSNLCCTVAKHETDILNMTDDSKCSLYISIPFCPSRCTYCSFISYAGKKLFSLIPDYLDKLCSDIVSTAEIIKENRLTLSSIYIGGGTPTVLSAEQLEKLLSTVCSVIDVSSLCEYTLEGGRPDTITDEKLSIAKKYGITRISVNPQTLNDSVLERIGRRHTVEDFFEAYKRVKASGIKHINTDLIAGLEGDTYSSFKATVDKIISLDPDNVTVHSFCVKNAAQVRSDNKEIYKDTDDTATKCVDYAVKALTENGYIPYYMYRQKNTVNNLENVGYAKADSFGLYNVFMMSDAHTVFGVGAGSTTKLVKNVRGEAEILRIFSPKYPYEYLQETKEIKDTVKNFFERS